MLHDTTPIEKRMASGEPFSFRDLWTSVEHHYADTGIAWYVSAEMIQEWRKAGWIAYERHGIRRSANGDGRQVTWRLTPEGERSAPYR